MNSRITPKQTGTDLNPTENTFGGDPENLTPPKILSAGTPKKCSTRTHPSELNICAPKPRERGPRLDPVPVGFNAFLF